MAIMETFTIVFLQEANDLLQHGRFVHFPSVAREHGAELFDEDIELVPTLLLRLVSRGSGNTQGTGKLEHPISWRLCNAFSLRACSAENTRSKKALMEVSIGRISELSNGARNMFC